MLCRRPIAPPAAPRPASPTGDEPDEAGPAPRAAGGRRGRAAGRVLRPARRRPGLPGAGEPVDVAAARLPDHRGRRQRHRPARPQRPRRPEHLLGAGLPRLLRRATSRRWQAATSRSTPNAHRRERLPRTGDRLRGLPDPAGRGGRQRLLRPGAATSIVYDRALLEELVHRLRPVPRRRWSWPTSSATPCRAGSASPRPAAASRTRRRPTASPAPGPRWVADGKAEHVSLRTPELDDVVRGFLLLRDHGRQRPQRQPGARLLLRPRVGLLRGLRRRGRRPAGTTSAPTGCTPRPTFIDDTDSPTRATPRYDRDRRAGSDTTLPRVLAAVFPQRLRQRLHAARRSQGFDGTAPDCAGVRPDRDLGYCADDDDGLLRRDRPGRAGLRRDRRLRA